MILWPDPPLPEDTDDVEEVWFLRCVGVEVFSWRWFMTGVGGRSGAKYVNASGAVS